MPETFSDPVLRYLEDLVQLSKNCQLVLFFNDLSFIRDSMTKRKTESNLELLASDTSILDTVSHGSTRSPTNTKISVSTDKANSSTYINPFKKQKTNIENKKNREELQYELDSLIVKSLKSQDNHENIQENKRENDRERHPDEFYGLSLVETFKNLDPEIRFCEGAKFVKKM